MTLSAVAASSPSTGTVPSLRPAWAVGDWWVVTSQVYDHGDKKPGAVPGWLDKEPWHFSVVATNAIDGEACYEVSIKPGDGNRCPYWFSCWFRMADLLVMCRELHQPKATRTGRPFSALVVQADYSKNDESPFIPSDFPNLPMTTPHFAGRLTNSYAAKAAPVGPGSVAQGTSRKSARSFTGFASQSFHPHETMPYESALRAGAASALNSKGASSTSGLFVVAQSSDGYERQNWHSELPWHVYAEKCEHGVAVRRSWLADHGHAAGAPVDLVQGGGK